MFSDEIVQFIENADVVICPCFIEIQELRYLKNFTVPKLLEINKHPIILLKAKSKEKERMFEEVKKDLEETFKKNITVINYPVLNLQKFLDNLKNMEIAKKIDKVRKIKAIQEISEIINNKILH
jgi:hypothetical protein